MSALLDLPPSPVTGEKNVRVAEEYAAADIIRVYRQQ